MTSPRQLKNKLYASQNKSPRHSGAFPIIQNYLAKVGNKLCRKALLSQGFARCFFLSDKVGTKRGTLQPYSYKALIDLVPTLSLFFTIQPRIKKNNKIQPFPQRMIKNETLGKTLNLCFFLFFQRMLFFLIKWVPNQFSLVLQGFGVTHYFYL